MKVNVTFCLYLPVRDFWSGTLTYSDRKYYYSWWAKTNGSICVKQHSFIRSQVNRLIDKKIKNGYEKTDLVTLLKVWPQFLDQMESTMLFERLKND